MSIYKIAFKKVISKDFTERYTYRIQLKTNSYYIWVENFVLCSGNIATVDILIKM